MVEGFAAGADAVLAASIFHYGEYSLEQVREAAGRAPACPCGRAR